MTTNENGQPDTQRGRRRPNILILCIDQWDVPMKLPEGEELPALERLQNRGMTSGQHRGRQP